MFDAEDDEDRERGRENKHVHDVYLTSRLISKIFLVPMKNANVNMYILSMNGFKKLM